MFKRKKKCGCSRHSCPLSELSEKSSFRVCKIAGDGEMRSRIFEMGIFPGKECEVVSVVPGSGVVVFTGESRVMLTSALAQEITVQHC